MSATLAIVRIQTTLLHEYNTKYNALHAPFIIRTHVIHRNGEVITYSDNDTQIFKSTSVPSTPRTTFEAHFEKNIKTMQTDSGG